MWPWNLSTYHAPAKTQCDQPFDSLCMLWLSFDSNVVLQLSDFNTIVTLYLSLYFTPVSSLYFLSVCILPLTSDCGLQFAFECWAIFHPCRLHGKIVPNYWCSLGNFWTFKKKKSSGRPTNVAIYDLIQLS